ncbi:valine--tRNA ligase [Candidatus Woesearchaeota archaeon CG_4_10_14_0_2_um_filter_57_5]|nr:MAG: valine--tRNA ligase [Candidatus Woesearchaeota archaeon CG_4_10_14_0_2_um_filter_57_5]
MGITEKRWTKDFEQPLSAAWRESKVYAFDETSEKPVYSIDTPPPYVNRPVHIGQATTYVLMDMFARFRRMMGYQVLFPLGLDRNGLPIEMEAERRFKVDPSTISRDEFIGMCRKVLEESSAATTETFLRLGISFNSYDEGDGLGEVYKTDSASYRAVTQTTFIDLYQKGLIYKDARINNYCPHCKTTLADSEVEYANLPSSFNDIVFTCKETGEELIIGTTRPELVCTCGMVIYHPNDERYQHLDGKTAVSPVFGKEVLIKAHPQADPEKGTGLVMMCSAGDLSDIRFFRDEGLEPVIAIGKDGRMNEHAGFLQGKKIKEAREAMMTELDSKGLLRGQAKVQHRTPICERSKTPIEFIAMEEWYLKQVDKKDTMLALGEKMNFFAEQSRQIYSDWVNSVSIDWPISRRRYYATEVPLWYCKDCQEPYLPPAGKYYRPWKEAPPIDACPSCGCKDFIGEHRVFDTWFDSSISPLYILKWGSEFYDRNPRCSLRPQGKEIIRTWLYYTVLKCHLLTGKCIFKDAWINYHILDGKGKKMSKSLGNVIDPMEIIKQHGAEPFRLWCAIEGNLEKTDFRCSSERIDGAGKTLVKLWNVVRFVSQFDVDSAVGYELTPLDNWIVGETNALIALARERYEKYDFHNPSQQIKHFLWETFASHYLELVKNRTYNSDASFTAAEQQGAIHTLHWVIEQLLALLAPVVPFITAKLYTELCGSDVHALAFPEAQDVTAVDFSAADIAELNSMVWKSKKDAGRGLRDGITKLVIPEKLSAAGRELQSAHGAAAVATGELCVEL